MWIRIQLEAKRILNDMSRKEFYPPCYGPISYPSSPVGCNMALSHRH
jgi:hypothetical protein